MSFFNQQQTSAFVSELEIVGIIGGAPLLVSSFCTFCSPRGWGLRLIHLLSCHEYGLFLLVSIRVLDHAIFTDEAFATDFTGKGFLTRMQAHVTPQICLVIKLLGTNFAFVGLVTSMLGQVFL